MNGSRRPGAHRLRLRHREQQKLRVERSKRFLIGRESEPDRFRFCDMREIGDSLTRRWSAERTLRDSAEMFVSRSAGTETESASVPTNACAREALHFFYLGAGFWGFGPASSVHVGHSICTGRHDVRLSLHVHGQPRGGGLWPRCHRRAHGSRRGEQGRRRRKQRVLPREGVRQDDDEVVARGCVPAHPADERETRNARRRDRARDATARSGRVASERAEARAPGSARRRRVGPRLFGPRVSGKSVASRPVAFSPRFTRLSFETRSTILSFFVRALTVRSSLCVTRPIHLNDSPNTHTHRTYRCRRSPRRRRARARERPRRAGGRGGRAVARVHAARHAPRPRAHLGVPRAPGHARRAPHAQAPPQEGAQVPRAGGRAQHVEQGEAQEPQVSE